MTTERTPEDRPRRLLALGSWTMLCLFGLLFLIVIIPPLERVTSAGQPLGPVVGGISGLLIAFGWLAIWVGALWHASVVPTFYSEGHRVTVVGLLLLGNLFAGMLYYFGYVYWRHRAQSKLAAV